MTPVSILGAVLGGVGPTLLWLWFWLREDSKHPEPRRLIALAFITGMVAVAIVIPIEQYVASLLADQTVIFTAWSAIEEMTKFALASLAVLNRHEDDEPIDPIIYMVVVALGFAAAENTLFLLSPISGISLSQTIITGDYRFVGATLLHVLASAVIGAFMALSFYEKRSVKFKYVTAGVILAIGLHGLFNYLIMSSTPQNMLQTFVFVWVGLIALLAFLEFVKRLPTRRV